MFSSLFLVAAIATVSVNGDGTVWKKCSLLKSQLCFETVISEITVKIGNPGTNDDVVMEICSDYDNTNCCKTPALKSALSDDWSKGDTEKWTPRYFGPCKNKKFKVRRGLSVTLSKDKTGPLNVTSIQIDTKSPEKKVKETERFMCKERILLGGKNPTKMTQLCKTDPYKFMRIRRSEVMVGADGTDDDVKVKVCSDSNNVCCDQKLSHLFSDDWKKNKKQVWEKSDFGDCAKILYKVNNQPIISVSKNGKDDLVVKDFAIEFETNDDTPVVTRYACEGFSLKGDCKNESLCRYVFSRCTSRTIPQSTLKNRTTTKRPGSKTKTKTTTKRPPFRG